MNSTIRNLMMIAGATLGGVGAGAGIVFAQVTPAPDVAPMGTAPATQPAVAMPLAARGPAVPGTLVVTPLSETQFVVVKDTGEGQIVTLFSTAGGLIKKQHSGKFLY